jgi:ATP-dependent DNA ligase
MLEYNKYTYLFPPRPETAIPDSMLGFYASRGWVFQPKMNGTCTVVFTNGEEVIYKTRHDDDHKQWTPLSEHNEFFRNLAKDGKWAVLVGELLHHKTPNIKNKLYLFDIIVYQGLHLVGERFSERLQLLENLVPGKKEKLWHEYNKHIVRARTMKNGHRKFFTEINESEVEGIVCKNPEAGLHVRDNGGWQVKCRVPHKNYGF